MKKKKWIKIGSIELFVYYYEDIQELDLGNDTPPFHDIEIIDVIVNSTSVIDLIEMIPNYEQLIKEKL
jgi:hypothetical protein